jgi:hypothetical protein
VNIRLVAANVTHVAVSQAGRFRRQVVRRTQRLSRLGWKHLVSPLFRACRRAVASGKSLPARGGKMIIRTRRAAVKTGRRGARMREHVIEPWLEQRRIERQLAALARGEAPVIVGPWLSEVGYEVLYWRPFLAWMLDRYRIDPQRVVAVSRGGVADWYAGIAARYVELLDMFPPDAFASRNAARRGSGDQKQLAPGDFDADIVARVAERLGGAAPVVCHPSLMFRLFRPFWFGDRSLDFFLNHVRFERMQGPAEVPSGLPARFAAVKFYMGAAVPDTPERRRTLRGLVSRLAMTMPVVVLDTGLTIDEHRDFLFEDVPNVTAWTGARTPATNLAVQTQVIARASLFVGTCGSLAWLAPMLGTPTIGVYADDRFLAPHLFVARHAYRMMQAAPFTTIDLTALDALDLVPDVAAAARP